MADYLSNKISSIGSIGQNDLKTGNTTHSATSPTKRALSSGAFSFVGKERFDSTQTSYETESSGLSVVHHPGVSATTTQDTGEIARVELNVKQQDTTYYYETYIQSSPPYDLGDGEVPLFVFVTVTTQGEVQGTTIADDPPWAMNGPTNIHHPVWDENEGDWRPRTTIEKNADMDILPHPFLDQRDGKGNQVRIVPLLIEPVGDFIEKLRERKDRGEDLAEMVQKGHILFENDGPTGHQAPPGVFSVRARMRDRKRDGEPLKTLKKDEQNRRSAVETPQSNELPTIKEPIPDVVSNE